MAGKKSGKKSNSQKLAERLHVDGMTKNAASTLANAVAKIGVGKGNGKNKGKDKDKNKKGGKGKK